MKTLIKCEKCGSFKVDEIEVPLPPPQPKEPQILSMDEYIKQNGHRSNFAFSGDMRIIGTSRSRQMKLHCFDCGFEKEWTQIVYV